MLQTELITRPSFWNVPMWAEIAIYAIGILSMIVFAAGIIYYYRVRHRGLAKERPIHKKSFTEMLWIVLGQRKISSGVSGKAHFLLFWGFIFLFLGTAIATLDWDIAWFVFNTRLLKGNFYLFYKSVLDISGFIALLCILYFALRRFVFNDPKVEPSATSVAILGSLAAIIVTGFCVEALRLAYQKPEWAIYSPIGYAISFLFSSMSESTLKTTHIFLWVIHGFSSLSFIAVLPLTYYSHLFKTPASIRRENVKHPAVLEKINDIENQETFGISDIRQFDLTDRIRFEGCTHCGRCRSVCPAVAANSALDPKTLIMTLQERMQKRHDKTPLIGESVNPEALWSCTTCGACANVCPARIPIPDIINSMRRHLALEVGEFPKGLAGALEHAASVGNPWGMDPGSRFSWAKGLDVPVAKPGENYDVLYWVGCSASYDKRTQKIARSMVTILKHAGVKFAVMQEERCHADWARRAGEEYLFQIAAAENIENLNKYSFKEIVCHCPHCFNTLKNEYPQFEGGRFTVTSHTEFIERLVHDKRLTFSNKDGRQVVLHDACYLARLNSVTKAPRSVLEAVGVKLTEAPRHKENSLCCGAGGAQVFMDRPSRANVIRIKELQQLKTDAIVVECPHCLTMLKAADIKDVSTIEDIAEIVAQQLKAEL